MKADDGRVTLSGSVPTYVQMLRAADDARAVGGVSAVDNDLLVGLAGEAIDDAEVAIASAAALDADKLVPKGAVHADVLNGYVTLTGRVRNHYQRQAAKHAVSRVKGVLGVDESITLTSDPIPSDVRDRVHNAFQRSAIIDESTVDVRNVGHTIELDGSVRSWAAKDEAEEAAWQAPGVQLVVNNIQVEA